MKSSPEPVGIIAGWGSFPVEVAEQLRSRGIDVYVAGLRGHASPDLQHIATGFEWKGVLKIGAQMRFLQRNGVSRVVLAGKIFKDRILYHGLGWIQHLPDLTTYRILGGSFVTKSRDGRDDTVLSAVVSAFERKSMKILSVTEVAPSLLIQEGVACGGKPGRSGQLDADFGWHIARQMGGLDIGQSVTVKDQVVLGVEAIEGTDALIHRTGALCPRGGFTLVKIAKPNQDMRFDVPTIGCRTVEQMAKAGGKTIVVEAGKTIFVDREETLRTAAKYQVRIIALSAEKVSSVTDTRETSEIAA
ncbi:MAG: LpxI family protein [Aureliella sp.]